MALQESTLGLGGYDAVSFFMDERPRSGRFEHKTRFKGLIYCFSTEQNLLKFQKDPAAYLPQFGGDCALGWGVLGSSRSGSPKAWHITAGKLYFHGNPIFKKLCETFPALLRRAHINYTPNR